MAASKSSSAKPKAIRNSFASFAKHLGSTDPLYIYDRFAEWGHEQNVRLTLFRHVLKQGTTEQLDGLLALGLRLDEDVRPFLERNALQYAAEQGNTAMVKYLIEHHGMHPDATLNPISSRNMTPLGHACGMIKGSTVKALLDLGADKSSARPYIESMALGQNASVLNKLPRIWNILKKHGVPIDGEVYGKTFPEKVLYYDREPQIQWIVQQSPRWIPTDSLQHSLEHSYILRRDAALKSQILAQMIEQDTMAASISSSQPAPNRPRF